jgi:hypothetical protein
VSLTIARVGHDDGFSHGHGKYDFSLPERLHGTGEEGVGKLFTGETGQLPYPNALPIKGFRGGKHYDMDAIARSASLQPEHINPVYLTSAQGQVTRSGVQHYMNSTELYADKHSKSNEYPLVYEGTDRQGQSYRSLLSGNHRAVAHLLMGKPMLARVVRGSTTYPDGTVS